MAQIVLTVVGNSIGGPVGGAVGNFIGSYIDSALFAKDTRLPDQIGPRLDNLKVQTSAYGSMVPQVFGYFRVGGNVIWARDIKETETRETTSSGGGKGGGGGGTTTQTTVTYSYSVTLAIAVCEGPVEEIAGVWADSKKLDARTLEESSGRYEVHLGAENQAASSIIESYDGVGATPAYRGIAYVVIEDFPLGDYGNRIPNFTFEVRRPVRPTPSVEDLVKDVVLIPGSGEFVYSTTVTEKYAVEEDALGNLVQSDKREKVNMHNFDNTANVNLAVSQLAETFPNLEWVAVVVNWFVTSKNMATGEIVPKVEHSRTEAAIAPTEWSVAGLTRATAQVVEEFPDGTPTYGGTPSDHTVIQLCTALKNAGYNVLFYPMPLVDTVDETAGEDDKPWRGRLVPTSASECNTWFTKTNGYNAFIRHYSQLSGLSSVIDAFVIGSELVGITTYDSGSNTYPGVTNLKTLAGLVAGDMPSVPRTYAADWSEYHSIGGYYHLDPLWTDSNIDFVGIDNYMPITPDLPQNQITQEVIKQYWEDGEGWEYFYTDSVNRTGKTDYSPNDGTSPYAWKNIEQWWNSTHVNPGPFLSGWTPKMKPIWFTEFGFPSVDACANQPNVFVDPSSSESFYPRGSKKRVDFVAQRDAINATLEFWQAKNAETGNSDLVPRMFLWSWDARPYPFFPDLLDVWADGGNWRSGHWVSGKFGISGLGAIIADLLGQVGFVASDYDVSALNDPVEGYILTERQTVRDHLELLRSLYFFDVVESDGVLKFIKRGNTSNVTIAQDDIVPEISGDIAVPVTITRKQELELPRQVDLTFVNRPSGYLATAQTAQRQTVQAVDKIGINAPIVMSDTEGRRRAEQGLYTSWVGRTMYDFQLPPEYAYIDGGDVITLTLNNVPHVMRVTSVQYGRNGVQKIKALAEDISTYDFYIEPGQATPNPTAGKIISNTRLQLMDLPRFPSDSAELGALRIAITGEGEGWQGSVIYRSDDGGESGGNTFNVIASGDSEAIQGNVLTLIGTGPRNYWDDVTTIDVVVLAGELQSATELAVLNGANVCLCGDEIIQFQTATLLATNKYRLSKLLRGRLGTEHEMATHSVGERFVFLDSAIIKSDVANSAFGLPRYYKPVTVGAALADTTEQTFTYTGKKFKPYSPVHIAGSRDGSNNLTVTWIRRTRIDGEWRDGVNVPLGEETESYEIDIMNGASVVRTLTSTSETVTYTAADQVTDFGSTQSSVDVKIYQMSAVVGRGTAGEATV